MVPPFSIEYPSVLEINPKTADQFFKEIMNNVTKLALKSWYRNSYA